ncbi:tetratricopeptide repeat protein [Bacteroides xylanisolvens]|jgi:tetratricopeptide (TPR) repeat protein/DNA-binding CsgD family transcriptional regulator|uniref:Tetratricopeptide repeat protein n=1 Tax=Bacteroides xylanisolvens TaxID=371601 RepID=A0A7J5PWH4_9BACE|nr:tetratricopeptide repeat protein [Bacteroides xylanisolvens]KAB6147074.1 tetratricopeptide repeat protein [Bacteroides xylanisolvens]
MRNYRFTFYITGLLFLILISSCRKTPQPTVTPQSELSTLYSQLREGYGTGDTTTAFSIVRDMLDFPIPADGTKPLHIRTLNRGLVQLMYCFANAERPDEGFSYFLRLADDNPPPLPVPPECKRQILILAAYLGMLSGELPKAVECLERGLQLPEPPTPDERYSDYTFAAAVYSQGAETIDKSIGMYEKALTDIKLSEDKSGLPWILGNLAELYGDNGEFEKAVKMYYESLDLFKARDDKQGIGDTYASLADLHSQWGMTDQAEMYANNGLKYARLSGHTYNIGYSMLQKYEVAEMKQQKDSALFWLQCADSCFIASNSPLEHLSAQGFITRLRLRDPAYLEEGTKRLEQICSDTLIMQTLYQPVLQQLLGECYLLLGHKHEGIQLIKSVLPQLEESKKDVILLESYHTLVRHFRQEKEYETAFAYQDKADELREKLFKDEKLHQVAASRIHYETAQKELENKVLQQTVELKQRTLIFTWLLVGLLFVILLVGGMYMRQRQRFLRQISNARLSQISGLLQAQQELKEKNESLLEMQEELRQSNEALFKAKQELSQHNASLTQELHTTSSQLNEVSSRLDAVSKQKVVTDLRMKISTQIFNSDKEAEFRRSFTAFYPNYIPALHRSSPDITRTDELIAMLIILELSSDEIGLTLGISRIGVNKARSRMRKRLGLAGDAKLEDFLKGIWD